jgi:SAM-dependent methyltransferase
MGKYVLNPDPYSMHTKIIQFINKSGRVLDVGCAEGYLSEKCYQNDCEVVGIEIDPENVEKAEEYCKEVINGDISVIELPDKYRNYFDYIIFADILEHIKNPLQVLLKFKEYLKDDGHILVSLPNISNWRVRLKILSGNFEYEDKGLLDVGHLRFFNEKSAKNLLLKSGFEICTVDVTVGDIKLFPKFFHFIGTLWPNLLAYQFLLIAKKNETP